MRSGVRRFSLLGLFVIGAFVVGGWLSGLANEPVAVVDVSAGDGAAKAVAVQANDGQASNGRAVTERPRPQPVMMDPAAAQAALDALERNGVLGRLEAQSMAAGRRASGGGGLLPVVHFVSCEEDACPYVMAWGDDNSMESSEIIVSFGHGGVEEFHIELSEFVPPAAVQLVRRAEAVMNGVNAIDGADYDEWMADNRTSLLEAGGE